MVEPYTEQSVFNMALAYLERINKLLYLCSKAAMDNNIDGWSSTLRAVYREASIRMTPDEEKNILGDPLKIIDIKKLTDHIIEPDEANFRNINFLLNDSVGRIKNRKVIMFLLDALEIKLRRLMQKKNMLLPSKDDPRRSIMER